MYLADKHGWPYEKRKGRPIHNFIRAVVLLLRGQLRFRKGKHDSVFDANGEINPDMKQDVLDMMEQIRGKNGHVYICMLCNQPGPHGIGPGMTPCPNDPLLITDATKTDDDSPA